MARSVTDPVNGFIIFFYKRLHTRITHQCFPYFIVVAEMVLLRGREFRFFSSNNLFSFIDFLYLNYYIIQISGSTTIMWHGNRICLAVYSLEPCDRRSYFYSVDNNDGKSSISLATAVQQHHRRIYAVDRPHLICYAYQISVNDSGWR